MPSGFMIQIYGGMVLGTVFLLYRSILGVIDPSGKLADSLIEISFLSDPFKLAGGVLFFFSLNTLLYYRLEKKQRGDNS